MLNREPTDIDGQLLASSMMLLPKLSFIFHIDIALLDRELLLLSELLRLLENEELLLWEELEELLLEELLLLELLLLLITLLLLELL